MFPMLIKSSWYSLPRRRCSLESLQANFNLLPIGSYLFYWSSTCLLLVVCSPYNTCIYLIAGYDIFLLDENGQMLHNPLAFLSGISSTFFYTFIRCLLTGVKRIIALSLITCTYAEPFCLLDIEIFCL